MGRAQLASAMSLLGLLLLVTGVLLLIEPAQLQAQDEAPEYEGARECRSCHRTMASDFAEGAHSQTLVSTEDEDVPLLADFSVGEDVRSVQFPGSDESRPFTANDIAFTLGTGVHVQRYLYEFEENVYMVFPAEWNTSTNEWQPYDTGEEWPGEAYNFNENCAYCHVTALEEDLLDWEDDGVQCEACHGPGSEHVILMDDLGFILNEEDREDLHESIATGVDPATCGQCHARGFTDSAHPFPQGFQPGDDLSEAWTLVEPDAEDYWHPTGQAAQPNMQYNEWLLSAHADSYTSATESEYYELECLTCHSAGYRRAIRILETSDEDPEVLPIPEVEADRLPFGVTCSTCHNPHETTPEPEEGEEETVIDPATAIYAQCTDCHQSAGEIAGLHHPVKEVFEGLALVEEVEPVTGVHFSAEEGPLCTTCHMPGVPVGDGLRNSHTMSPISPGAAVDVEAVQDSCTVCHDLVDGQSMQQLIDAVQDKTRERYDAAMAIVTDDAPEWVSSSLLVVANDGSWGVHNTAYTGALLGAVETELGLREEGSAPLVLPDIDVMPDEPEAEVATSNFFNTEVIFGLTGPALILVGIALGIIIIAGFAFFRGGDA